MFKPEEHLMQLQGKDYLEVKWRLVWFRQECPNGTIETQILHYDPDREVEEEVMVWNNETRRKEKIVKRGKGYCVFHAVVKDGKGGIGSGTKSETAVGFPDYLEKAESGSIGRALATLGYGTQFTGDELAEGVRLADSPVDRSVNTLAQQRSNGHQMSSNEKDPNAPMTEQQWAGIRKLCQHLGKAEPQQSDIVNHLAAKELIAQLSQEYKAARSKAS